MKPQKKMMKHPGFREGMAKAGHYLDGKDRFRALIKVQNSDAEGICPWEHMKNPCNFKGKEHEIVIHISKEHFQHWYMQPYICGYHRRGYQTSTELDRHMDNGHSITEEHLHYERIVRGERDNLVDMTDAKDKWLVRYIGSIIKPKIKTKLYHRQKSATNSNSALKSVIIQPAKVYARSSSTSTDDTKSTMSSSDESRCNSESSHKIKDRNLKKGESKEILKVKLPTRSKEVMRAAYNHYSQRQSYNDTPRVRTGRSKIERMQDTPSESEEEFTSEEDVIDPVKELCSESDDLTDQT